MSSAAPPVRSARRSYVLHGAIAAGGMATVHVGRLLAPGGFARRVAIKRLHPQFVADPEIAETFAEEARLSARIAHVNVAAVLDVVLEGGELLLVMEYVHGEALSRLLMASRNAKAEVSIPIVLSVLAGVLHGVHAAHEATGEDGEPLGLVHRDVSPQNVIVGVDGVARVVDFGIAKAMARGQITRDGQLKGKMPYMAPEQLLRRTIDRRVDVYAAGVILWEALAGARLFVGDSEPELFSKVLEEVVPPPSAKNPAVAQALDDVVMRALARDPSRRYATAREMALAIEALGTHAPASAVAEWVTTTAQEALEKRAATIAEMERDSGRYSSEGDTPMLRAPAASVVFRDGRDASPRGSSGVSVPASAPPPRRERLRWVVALALTLPTLIAIVALAAARTETEAAHAPIEATSSAPARVVSAPSAAPVEVANAPSAAPLPAPSPAPVEKSPSPARVARPPATAQWCKVFDATKGVYVMKSMRVSRCP